MSDLLMYRNAEHLMDAARSAAFVREKSRNQLARIESTVGLSGVDYSRDTVSGGEVSDGQQRIITSMTQRDILAIRISDAEQVMHYAMQVLYGNGHGGLAKLLTPIHSDVCMYRYIANETWDAAANLCGVTYSTARRMVSEAFDVIDAVGFDRAIAGVGRAEE